MDDDEAELAALGWEFRPAEAERGTEVWFATEPDYLPAAAVLHDKGWLERRSGPHVEWRLTNKAVAALRIDAATSGQSMN
jgi:hypothetical protein